MATTTRAKPVTNWLGAGKGVEKDS